MDESKDFYLTLFEEFPALIWRSGLDAKCNYFNQSWLEFTGRTLEQEWGDGWAEGVHPEDLDRCYSTYLNAFHARQPFEMEYRLRRHDGEYRWILDLGRPFNDSEGNFGGYLGSCYDITERKIAEEGLKRYQILSERARDIMLFVDADGNIIEANDAAIKAYGYTREEILEKKIFDIRRDAEANLIRKQLLQTEHQSLRYETIHYRKDESCFPVEVTTQGTSIDGQEVVLGVIRDITERKKAQEDLERAKDAAEAASLAKSLFLANMSHEIRTPMNGIIGLGELLSMTPLNAEQRELLDMITSSSNTLLKIINDILDFSKIESGKLEIEEIDFDFRSTVEKAVDAFALRAHEKGLELTCFIDDEIPEVLSGDPGRVRQIIVNLVGNAIKFTSEGEVTVTVQKVQGDNGQVTVQFSVADTGIGIAADKTKYIFESFTQADGSHTRQYGGTGLGLSISRQLVELMGGMITVTSEPGSGSTFSFTMPFQPQKGGVVPKPYGTDVRPEELKGLRVLVVDDNDTNRKILLYMLQNCGISVEMAASGEEGIELVQKYNQWNKPFDVILLDAHMPNMSGFAFAEHMKSYVDVTKTIIVMLTSAGMKGDLAKCYELGISSYLVKPVKKNELLQVISNLHARDGHKDRIAPGPEADGNSSDLAAKPLERFDNVNILLAEDNLINVRLTTTLLKSKGCNIVVAPNGIKVLEEMKKHVFDLILMDVQMPEMDGFEATRLIRAGEEGTETHIPIVAMTAYAMKEDRDKCLEAGMDDYISKPIYSSELYGIVRRMLRKIPEKAPEKIPDQSESKVDLAKILDILHGDKQELQELVNDFHEESHKYLQRIYTAICEENIKELEMAAHSLKGSVANFHIGTGYRLAHELETMARSGNPDRQKSLAIYENLQKDLESLYLQLKDAE